MNSDQFAQAREDRRARRSGGSGSDGQEVEWVMGDQLLICASQTSLLSAMEQKDAMVFRHVGPSSWNLQRLTAREPFALHRYE
eukprot:762422-Hanusia_phi.AAC.1